MLEADIAWPASAESVSAFHYFQGISAALTSHAPVHDGQANWVQEEQQQQQPLPTPGAVPLSGPQEPQSGATATPAPVDCCPAGDMDGPAAPSPIDAGAHDGEDDDEVDFPLP